MLEIFFCLPIFFQSPQIAITSARLSDSAPGSKQLSLWKANTASEFNALISDLFHTSFLTTLCCSLTPVSRTHSVEWGEYQKGKSPKPPGLAKRRFHSTRKIRIPLLPRTRQVNCTKQLLGKTNIIITPNILPFSYPQVPMQSMASCMG